MPDWMKRTDIDVDFADLSKPTWSIETIQPLYQSPRSLTHTFFTQGRWGYRDDDSTFNLGLGYRYLFDNRDWLFGVNGFYDIKARYSHQRLGAGVEAINRYITLRGNYYNGISGEKVVKRRPGLLETEKALDGWDAEIEGPIPFLPWLRIAGSTYHWDGEEMEDTRGQTIRLRLNLYENLYMELGRSDDNNSKPIDFIKLELSLGARPGQTPTLLGKPVTSNAFIGRDLTQHTLDKVRRNNDIVVERKRQGTGIAIGRRN